MHWSSQVKVIFPCWLADNQKPFYSCTLGMLKKCLWSKNKQIIVSLKAVWFHSFSRQRIIYVQKKEWSTRSFPPINQFELEKSFDSSWRICQKTWMSWRPIGGFYVVHGLCSEKVPFIFNFYNSGDCIRVESFLLLSWGFNCVLMIEPTLHFSHRWWWSRKTSIDGLPLELSKTNFLFKT